MAISRYDKPAEASYTPIPFQEISQAALARQQLYDQGAQAVDEVETELGTFTGLGQIYIPGKGTVEVGDRKRVVDRVNQHLETLSKLSSQYPDKSSPEFRNAARTIIGQIRKDKAPTGIFGRASTNVQKYGQVQKMLQDNPQLVSNPHLGMNVYSDLERFAQSSQQGIVDLETTSAIGKEMDVLGELATLVKEMEPTLIEKLGLRDGYITTESIEQLPPDRIQEATLSLLSNRTDLLRYAQQKDAFDGKDPQQTAYKLADTMARIFAQDKVKRDITADPYTLKGYDPNQQIELDVYDKLPVGMKHLGYTPTVLEGKIKEFESNATNKKAELTEFMHKMGIPSGSTIGTNGVDYSSTIVRLTNEALASQEEADRFKELNSMARRTAKIDDNFEKSDEYKEAVGKAKSRAGAVYTNAYRGVPEDKKPDYWEYVNNNYEGYLQTYLEEGSQYKTYMETLKNLGATSAHVVNLRPLPEKLLGKETSDFIKSSFNKYATSFETAQKGVVDSRTGESILDKSTFDDYSFKDAEFGGYYWKNGKLKLHYIVPSKAGEVGSKEYFPAEVAAPVGLENAILTKFPAAALEKTIEDQMSFSLEDPRAASQSTKIALKLGDLDKQIEVLGPNFNPSKRWVAYYPTDDGKVAIDEDSQESLRARIAQLYRLEAETKGYRSPNSSTSSFSF